MYAHLRVFLSVVARHPFRASAIAWWWVTGRRVRAKGRLREAVALLPEDYRFWLAVHQPESPKVAIWGEGANGPLFAVHVHSADGRYPVAAIGSVLTQGYTRWEIYLTGIRSNPSTEDAPKSVDDPRVHILPRSCVSRAAGLAAVLEQTQADHVLPLGDGCRLTPGALAAYASGISKHGPDAVIYADQDERDLRGRRSKPWFKPEWDEDLFYAQDYMAGACAIPCVVARQGTIDSAWSDDIVVYALLARLLIGTTRPRPVHLSYVTVTTPTDTWQEPSPSRAALVSSTTGIPATMGPFGTVVLHRALPDPPPKVSVIVPTRDRLDLLETCVEGVLHGTDYPDIELVIADNDSVEPATLRYFDHCRRDPRVKVVHWPYPYNYSAVNNFAVAQSSGRFVCLLNNDTEVIDPSWLREMMAHAVRPDVGAVGARLLYPDHSVQHAGVVVGMGNAAGHAHRGLPAGEAGWFAQASIARGATAVTAACLVVAKERFEAVGGLDEQSLAIAYNDIDFCLKLRVAGWRNVYVPQAVMIHHESKSRGLDFAPEHLTRYMRELQVFQNRWGTIGYLDPTHPPGLDPASETYRLRL